MISTSSEDFLQLDGVANIIDLTNKDLEKIPFSIPDNNSIFTLFLSHNRFQELPTNLTKANNIILSFNNYNEIPISITSTLTKLHSLKCLDLSYNKIEQIPDEIIQINSLKKLKLFRNKISSIPKILNENLTTVDIGYNSIQEIPSNFPNLISFHADRNLIKSLNTSFNNITKLCLSKNQISSISKNLFFPELLILDLSNNEIKELPNFEAFSPKLKTLDASFNSIQSFPIVPKSTINVFLHHNSIENIDNFLNSFTILVDLSFNEIKELLDLPPFLITLNVSNNKIKKINPINSENIKTINFSMNFIEKVPFINCDELHFSFNRISLLDTQILNKITVIDVSSNNLTQIPIEIFMIPTINSIMAAFNHIHSIPENISDSTVKKLDLSFNPISQISELPLNIENFILNYCQLSEIPSFLSNYKELVEISFVGNRIQSIENSIPKQIQKLNLSNNELNGFSHSKIILKNLRYLDLSMNSFTDFSGLFNNAKFPNLFYLNLSSNPVKQNLTFSFNSKLRKLILTNLNLSEELDLSNLPGLRYLDLSGSQFLGLKNSNEKIELIEIKNDKKTVSYSNQIGKTEAHENYILMKNQGENHFYGIFSEFDFMENKVIKKLNENHDNFSFVNEFVSDVYSPFALLIEASKKFSAVICGNYLIVSITNNGNFVELNDHQKVQEIYDVMDPKLIELKIPDDTKYIIFTEYRSLQTVSPQLVSSMALKAKDASDLSLLLKTAMESFDQFHNFSVIVVDYNK